MWGWWRRSEGLRGGGGGEVEKRLTRSEKKRKTGNPRRRSCTRSIDGAQSGARRGNQQKGLGMPQFEATNIANKSC